MTLALGIDLEQYERQAKELLLEVRSGDGEALARLRAHHPALKAGGKGLGVQLADAQLVIARENEFASWARFRDYLLFRNALAALDAGDVRRLALLLDERPSILHYECRVGQWYEQGYFAGATLLRHVAGNPIRSPLPPNVIDIARLLVERGATREEAYATIALVLTSRQASESGVALELIDVLMLSGARFDVRAKDVLTAPLLNGAPETARALADRGARVELHHAAAFGDITALDRMLENPTTQMALEQALVFACVCGQSEAVTVLVRRGARGDVLLAPGDQTPRTALHEAANRGHLAIAQQLLAAGARTDVREPRWNGTAADWAMVGGHSQIALLLSVNSPS